MGEVALPTPHPHPLPRTIPLEAVDLHRDLWCEHYEDCLGEAVARDWASWSCLGCPLRGTCQVKPELRTGGDGALAQAVETATGAFGIDRVRASMADVFARLSQIPQTESEIAGEDFRLPTVRQSLRRLQARGIARTIRTSQGSGGGGGYGWIRTGQRICERCEERLPASAYAPRDDNPDGLHDRCNTCRERAHARTLARRMEWWRERKEGE